MNNLRKILIAVSLFASCSCSKEFDTVSSAIGSNPVAKSKKSYGPDFVKNLVYEKNSNLTLKEVTSRLEAQGLLRGGVKTDFSGNPFLIAEADMIKEKEIIAQEAFVFSEEELAIVIYDLENWIVIEINKW